MKALVYHGPGKIAWEDAPDPVLRGLTDAIVKIGCTSICGTDLHIVKGEVPAIAKGRILGHEGVGTVVSAGSAVRRFKAGDRVLISCISACGSCEFCKKSMPSHCLEGGWILGNQIDGCQAELVRIPWADNSLYAAPAALDDESLVMLSDLLPTGFECGVLKGQVKPGDRVAIVGSGPVGLAALLTAQLYSPAEIVMVDIDDSRLEAARLLGATKTFGNSDGKAAEKILELTGGEGVDVAIEAVGSPATLELCESIIAVGGHIANIGVHSRPSTLDMQRLWDRGITLTTRLVDGTSIPTLLKMLAQGRLDARNLATHRFELSGMMQAYEAFSHPAKSKALKVILKSSN